jgi:hypothetical protein
MGTGFARCSVLERPYEDEAKEDELPLEKTLDGKRGGIGRRGDCGTGNEEGDAVDEV